MLKLEHAPSAIPDEPDHSTYLVIDAIRRKGHIYRETAVTNTDLERVVTDLMEGQYVEPVCVVGFNVDEGWSRDVSVEVAQEIERRSIADGLVLPKSLCKFIAGQRSADGAASVVRMRAGTGCRSRSKVG